ncbi:MAG: nitroreductase family protein [Synergistaceae bacterium]|nr:nitroreductase family protein [Synergistaceae bacterium]
MDLSLTRQSCRNFVARPVERDKLVRCVEAARLAPSGCNSQPWSFVIVDNPEIVPEVAKCGQALGNEFASKAGAFIVVLEEHAILMPALRRMLDSQYFAKGDLGAASICICLEAADQGLGTCVLGLFDRETLCKLLDLPQDQRFASLIAVGYPAEETIRPKQRKPLDAMLKFV